MELRDLCGGPPAVILNKESTVMDAIAAMVENKTRCVVIDREDTGDAYGLLTITDIIEDVIARGLEPLKLKAADIESKPLIASNNLDLGVRWVAKKMANEEVSQLAIFEGEDLKCIVSDVDILKAFAKKLKGKDSSEEEEK
ncbi:MAG: CBS domain-containing protein [Thermoplasmata archaeon]|nr:CBS domain-containing protein [Thermoplasmata archaeon]